MSGLQPGGPFSWGDATPSSGEEMVEKNGGTNDVNLTSAPQIVSSEPTFNPFQAPPTRGHIPHTFEAGEIPMEEWHSDEESSDQVTHIEYGDITEPATEHSINNTPEQKRNDPELAYPYIKSHNQEIEELEEYPSDELGQAAELQSPKLPWYWRMYYAFFPATQEEFRPWFFGVLLDIFFLIIIIVLLVSLYYDDPGKIEEAWFFPFLGIFGAIISTSTPAGGGVVFFPFMVLIDVKAQEAAAFSMTTQAFSMGVFGAGQWIRKAPKGLIVYWMVFVVVAASWGGVITSMLLLPITNGGALEAFFLIFVILLAIYVLYGLVRGELQTQNSKVKRTLPNVVALLILGLLGGMLVGYIAVGIDIMFFILMTFIYKANSNMATVDSILIMGWSCWLPAFLNIVAFDDLKFNFVLMTLIGSLIGARIGPALNILLGRRNVLIAFEVLLVIEILRAIAFLFLAPLIFSGSEFFWTANYSD